MNGDKKDLKYELRIKNIEDLLNFEFKKYKSKGNGIIFAILFALAYIIIFPQILMKIWPENIKNPGIFQAIIIFLFHEGTVIFVNLEFFIIYSINHPFFERYKTTPNPWPWLTDPDKWKEQLNRTFKRLFINHFLILPIFLLPEILSNEASYRLDKESFPFLGEIIIQLAICMICEDFLFYFSHLSLHQGKLYKYIHKIHHEYVETISLSATYSHPIEYIFGNILPSAVAPLILGKRMHLITYIVYLVMILHESHDGHSGYNFSWSPHRIIPFSFDAEFHIFHHWKYDGNYANYLSIWDRIFGTVNKQYIKYFKNKEKYIKDFLELNKEKLT